jgi:hypothetical protein
MTTDLAALGRPFPNEREHREGNHWWRCAPITELRLAEERASRCPDCGVAPGEGGHSWGCRVAVHNAEAALSGEHSDD